MKQLQLKINLFLKYLAPIADFFALPLVLFSAIVLKIVRRVGLNRLPMIKQLLFSVGVFPIRDHYYEPLFNPTVLTKPLSSPRNLPGIDFNIDKQLAFINSFDFHSELEQLSCASIAGRMFKFDNDSFKSGDAEMLYNIIRHVKPRRVIEIGSGNSTLVAALAIKRNNEETRLSTEHICIEPYEIPWLEQIGVTVIRQRVEHVDITLFSMLQENDILFIDSSHIIRPQGDVLHEYLEILPNLSPGVIVHVHDIFSPRDYLDEWVRGDVRFWNEQYLLEAFLSCNKDWEILVAVNLLHHEYPNQLKEKCIFLTSEREPGSFYMRRNHINTA